MHRKLATIVVCALLISPVAASADTLSDLLTQLKAALAQLQSASQMSAASIALADDYGTGEPSGYCPNLTRTMQRGATDARTGGQVTELQLFLASHYDLDENEAVSGFFGKTTHRYVVQFQKENGLPALGIAGSLTRSAIARLCGASQTISVAPYERPTTQTLVPYRPATCTFTANSSNRSDNIGFAAGVAQTADNCKSACLASQSAKWGVSESGTCVFTGENYGSNYVMPIAAVAQQPQMTSPVTIGLFTVSPSAVVQGQSVTFSWSSNLSYRDMQYYGGGCYIEGLSPSNRAQYVYAPTEASASYTFIPSETALFTLRCTSGAKDGSPMATRQVSVSVTDSAALPRCPTNAVSQRGQNGLVTACFCPPGFPMGNIWGGAPDYTDDSDICVAGAQVGQMSSQYGGEVDYKITPGQSNYPAWSGYGIGSSPRESWTGGSFRIVGPKG